ncbi:MAG: dihydroorotate dehydrogenase-like protein [Thermoanaerobaculia bacterium]
MAGVDLRSTYLGIELAHPLMPGASPLSDDLDTVRRLEDAGAAAIVMRSLFEEQVEGERAATEEALAHGSESFGEALSYLPEPAGLAWGPDDYLERIRSIKQAVGVPVIASLNGTTNGGWLAYAQLMEAAGADALELNVYELETDAAESATTVEQRTLEVAQAVTDAVMIPVTVKLSPFYTSLAHFATRLDEQGIAGLVLFNRFYQPDVDPEQMELVDTLHLSESSELLLRLRWIAILRGRLRSSIAASGGVHGALDVVKAVMCGADAVQMVSELLRRGPARLAEVRADLARWLEEHEIESLDEIRGSLSLERCPDPKRLERANYMRVLASWRSPLGAG